MRKIATKQACKWLFALLAFAFMAFASSAMAQTNYSTADIAAIKAMIDNNGLQWTWDLSMSNGNVDPNWTGVTWDSNTPKRIVYLDVSDQTPKLTGTLDVHLLTMLAGLDCSDNELTGLNVAGLSSLNQYLYCQNNKLSMLLSMGTTGITNTNGSFDGSGQKPDAINMTWNGTDYTSADITAGTFMPRFGATTYITIPGSGALTISGGILTATSNSTTTASEFGVALGIGGVKRLTGTLTLRFINYEPADVVALNDFIKAYPGELTSPDWEPLDETLYALDGTVAPTAPGTSGLATGCAVWDNTTAPRKLIELNVRNKNLAGTLDFSAFKNLKTLNCEVNGAEVLVLPAPTTPVLAILLCGENQLEALPALPASLTQLDCHSNQLDALPALTALTNLTYLDVSDNLFAALLDLSALTALNHLDCSHNQLTELTLGNTGLFSYFEGSYNKLAKLALGTYGNITGHFGASNQEPDPIDMIWNGAGGYESGSLPLLAANNTIDALAGVTYVAGGGGKLTATTPGNTTPDFSTVSGGGAANRLTGKLTLNYITYNAADFAALDAFIAANQAILVGWMTSTDPSNATGAPFAPGTAPGLVAGTTEITWDATASPQKLTGLNLSGLDWNEGTLDVSTLSFLTLDCTDSNVGELILASTLTTLDCKQNPLGELDLSTAPNLVVLNCSDTQLDALDVSALTALAVLDCSVNAIEALDLSASPFLAFLKCDHNALTELLLPTSPTPTAVIAANQVDIDCSFNKLLALDLSAYAAVTPGLTVNLTGSDQTAGPIQMLANPNATPQQFEADLSPLTLLNPLFYLPGTTSTSAVSYSSPNLTAPDDSETSVDFTVETGLAATILLSGVLELEYVITEIDVPIELTGLTEPWIGDAVVTPAEVLTAPSTAKYTVGGVTWSEAGGTWNPSADPFALGEVYTVTVVLYPHFGYAFPPTIQPSGVKIDNAEVTSVDIDPATGDLTVTLTFDALENIEITTIELTGLGSHGVGDAPATDFATSSLEYTVPSTPNNITWGGAGTYDASGNFAEGEFTASVVLTPEPGYAFPATLTDITAVSIDGTDVTAATEISAGTNPGEIIVIYTFTLTPQTISDVVLEVAPPAIGVPPSSAVTITPAYSSLPAGYTATATWTGTFDGSGDFDVSQPYTVTITLTPEQGNTFDFAPAAPATASASINGVDVLASEDAGTVPGTVEFSYTFPAIEEITDAVVWITEPLPGNTPALTGSISFGTGFTIDNSSITWESVTDPAGWSAPAAFVEGHQYKVTVTLDADDYYAFTSGTDAQINWNNYGIVTTWTYTPTSLTMTYEFPVLYKMTIEASTGGSIYYTGTTYQMYLPNTFGVQASTPYGTDYTATPSNGYRFTGWTTTGGLSISTPSSARLTSYTTPASGNVTLRANFEPIPGTTPPDPTPDPDLTDIYAAIDLVQFTTLQIPQEAANTEASVRAWLAEYLNSLFNSRHLYVSVNDIIFSQFASAVAGTASNVNGTNGAVTFSAIFSKGSHSVQVSFIHGAIVATKYVPPTGNEVVTNASLKAISDGGQLVVSGLSAGDDLKVYNVAGVLIYNVKAKAAEVRLDVARGIYIVSSGKQTVKTAVR